MPATRTIWPALVLATVLFWAIPLFQPQATIHWDLADVSYPAQKYFADSIHAGRLPLLDALPVLGDAVSVRSADRRMVSAALAVLPDRHHPAPPVLGAGAACVPGPGRSVPAGPQAVRRSRGRRHRGDVLRLGRILRRAQLAAGNVRSRGAAAVAAVGLAVGATALAAVPESSPGSSCWPGTSMRPCIVSWRWRAFWLRPAVEAGGLWWQWARPSSVSAWARWCSCPGSRSANTPRIRSPRPPPRCGRSTWRR